MALRKVAYHCSSRASCVPLLQESFSLTRTENEGILAWAELIKEEIMGSIFKRFIVSEELFSDATKTPWL